MRHLRLYSTDVHEGARMLIRIIRMALLCLPLLASATAVAHQRIFHFEIQHQSLSEALRNYGRICGQELIFTDEVLSGTGEATLHGDFSAPEALSRLLEGTNLVAQRSASGVV